MTELDLKPCPFCGAHGRPTQDKDEYDRISYGVQCTGTDCHIIGPQTGTRQEADAAWNTRPSGGEAVAEVHSGTLRWLVLDDDRPNNCKLYASVPLQGVVEALRKALQALDHIDRRAHEIGLVGTSTWDQLAGFSDIHDAREQARTALSARAQAGGEFEQCPHCSGSGLELGWTGEPTHCHKCKGNTVVPAGTALMKLAMALWDAENTSRFSEVVGEDRDNTLRRAQNILDWLHTFGWDVSPQAGKTVAGEAEYPDRLWLAFGNKSAAELSHIRFWTTDKESAEQFERSSGVRLTEYIASAPSPKQETVAGDVLVPREELERLERLIYTKECGTAWSAVKSLLASAPASSQPQTEWRDDPAGRQALEDGR